MKSEYEKMNDEERIRLLETIRIVYPRQTSVVEEIKQCREKSKYSREPRCMFIYGRPGVGKSTIKDLYLDQCKVDQQDEINYKNPILSMNSPVQATVKSLLSEMLRSLGDPAFDKGTTQAMSARLEHLIKVKEIELIILDEFQRLIDIKSNKVLRDVAEKLTIIINNTKVPFVFIGLPIALEVFKSEEYFGRRCMIRKEIKAFEWGPEFIKFIEMIERELPLLDKSNLTNNETAYSIYQATNGIAHYIMTLIKEGAELAIKKKTERILPQFLACAYMNQVKNIIGRPDPFGYFNETKNPIDKEIINQGNKKYDVRDALRA